MDLGDLAPRIREQRPGSCRVEQARDSSLRPGPYGGRGGGTIKGHGEMESAIRERESVVVQMAQLARHVEDLRAFLEEGAIMVRRFSSRGS